MTAPLRSLREILAEFGPASGERKRALIEKLARTRLASARAVRDYHEALCFLRAYPDDAALLALVESQLAGFARRADLKRFAIDLQDSGIAGTETYYLFFAEMAQWLVRRWPEQVTVAWDDFEEEERLEGLLPLLLTYAETPGLDEYSFPVREWCRRLKRPDETDAAFLVERCAALGVGSFLREWIYQDLQLPLCLAPGPDTPSRTRARLAGAKVAFQSGPLERGRPDLRAALARAPRSVRALSRREGQRVIDLAREAMVTRSRDLDVFSYGDPDDVRLIDWGGGLQFAAIGALPERRLLLEAVYGFLTLKNGVPIGYVLNSALFGSAEIAYNVFETFRGGEAAAVYAQVLATVRHLFASDSFTVYPYQLGGDGNDEGLRSGAWWFYQKLGFRAKHAGVLGLMERESRRLRAHPARRTSIATLRKLAAENVYFHSGTEREDVIGILPLADVGLAVSDRMARLYGSERERGLRECSLEAGRLLGLRGQSGWTAGEKLAWSRWAPLVVMLPGVARWKPAARRALVEVIRAKGGRRESDFVRRFDAHRLLRRALVKLAAGAVSD
jgi:hypothetical protein